MLLDYLEKKVKQYHLYKYKANNALEDITKYLNTTNQSGGSNERFQNIISKITKINDHGTKLKNNNNQMEKSIEDINVKIANLYDNFKGKMDEFETAKKTTLELLDKK